MSVYEYMYVCMYSTGANNRPYSPLQKEKNTVIWLLKVQIQPRNILVNTSTNRQSLIIAQFETLEFKHSSPLTFEHFDEEIQIRVHKSS